jgi:hypothetical protein
MSEQRPRIWWSPSRAAQTPNQVLAGMTHPQRLRVRTAQVNAMTSAA